MSSDDNEETVLKRLSVRELRTRAVKALGSKVAAGLKLKDELVDALVERAGKALKKGAAPAKKAAAPAKAPPKKAEKKAEPVVVAKTAKKAEKPEKAEKAAKPEPKKTPPRKTAAPKAVAKKAAPAKAPARPKILKPSKAQAMAEVYELPITRDFFVDPRRPSLPASYGDDRLLCFRREPLAIVVSWDLSAATFENGEGLALELVTLPGKLVGSVPVTAPTGLATFEELPEGEGLAVQVVRRGRVMTRGRQFVIGTAKASKEEGGAWQMTVPIDEPLPEEPEATEWPDAPVPVPGQRRSKVRASSSRLSS